jgi:alpha-1,2-mannosyltransferase
MQTRNPLRGVFTVLAVAAELLDPSIRIWHPRLARQHQRSSRSPGVARLGGLRRGRSLATRTSMVFMVAMATRLSVPLFGGGFDGGYKYDAPVYYSAGMGLIHGRLPYRDFVLVHPPLIAFATTPFAALGEITTDRVGFIAANVAFTLLGALNAALVVQLARHLGLGSGAATVGGLVYAIWAGSVSAEYEIRLEPLGNTLLLLGLLALLVGVRRDRKRLLFVTGTMFGLAVNVKIWWAVAALVAVGWAFSHGAGRAARVTVGGLSIVLLLDLPMMLLTRGNMWTMAITTQLGRPRDTSSLTQRLWTLSGAESLSQNSNAAAVGSLVLIGVAGLFAVAWRVPRCRLIVLIGIGQLAVLAVGPTWYSYYPDYFAVTLSVSVAAVIAVLRSRDGLRSIALPLAAVVVVGSFSLTVTRLTAGTKLVRPIPNPTAVTAVLAKSPCVASDSPMLLIAVDALGRSFDPGCHDWVDVYGLDGYTNRLGSRLVDSSIRPGLVNYLTSDGTAAINQKDPNITNRQLEELRHRARIRRVGSYLVSIGPPAHTARGEAQVLR